LDRGRRREFRMGSLQRFRIACLARRTVEWRGRFVPPASPAPMKPLDPHTIPRAMRRLAGRARD